MQKFTSLDAVALPLGLSNVDTDQIIPARFLRKSRTDGLAAYLFHDLRFNGDGSENPTFLLNRASYRDARIIVADRNFGCGSSREHAVWALWDYGFRVAIAPSFSDIFSNNCYQNGFLPVVVSPVQAAEWRRQLDGAPGTHMSVDLKAQRIVGPDGVAIDFEIDSFRKHCLLSGLDDIGFTLELGDAVAAFEKEYRRDMTWL
jgi:3-isopropylmalate/(R)-2-methylmalate dehydratase small subunit